MFTIHNRGGHNASVRAMDEAVARGAITRPRCHSMSTGQWCSGYYVGLDVGRSPGRRPTPRAWRVGSNPPVSQPLAPVEGLKTLSLAKNPFDVWCS